MCPEKPLKFVQRSQNFRTIEVSQRSLKISVSLAIDGNQHLYSTASPHYKKLSVSGEVEFKRSKPSRTFSRKDLS